MSIAIVTDSTADIPSALAGLHKIQIIPAILIINGKSIEDGKGITRQEFYELMPAMETLPTTSTPAAGTFARAYDKLIQEGFQSILSIHVSSQLSGICNTAQIAAQTFNNRVKIIDSGQLSLGLGYQVLAAAEAVARGVPLDKIIQEVENVRSRVRVVAMLDTLEYVRKSGRVSWARASIGSLLRIKPFLEVKDGQVLSLGQARTRKKGIEHLITLLKKIGKIEK
ncbi:MAG: DegV family protein, partial [Anaerolineales bacterium]|nr:DegV family protein [Anaerolineales bacterium]